MLELKAHAKVNLGLNVLAKRSDGFHNIDTLMVRLELHDMIQLSATTSGITLDVQGIAVSKGPKNLAYQAAALYLQKLVLSCQRSAVSRQQDDGAKANKRYKNAQASKGVHIMLEKRIPVAAGLGGGSADAAAVLRGMAQLYPSEVNLLELAGKLGSDVSFFVSDFSAARAQGRGEHLESVRLPKLHVVLVNPRIFVRARDAYQHLQGFSPGLDADGLIGRLEQDEEPGYLNSLQGGVLELEPTILEVITALRDAGLRGVLMSGSGSTCFGLAKDAREAREAAEALKREHPAWWIKATFTV